MDIYITGMKKYYPQPNIRLPVMAHLTSDPNTQVPNGPTPSTPFLPPASRHPRVQPAALLPPRAASRADAGPAPQAGTRHAARRSQLPHTTPAALALPTALPGSPALPGPRSASLIPTARRPFFCHRTPRRSTALRPLLSCSRSGAQPATTTAA